MKVILAAAVTTFICITSANAHVVENYYREKDGNTQHLYYTKCYTFEKTACDITVVSVSTEKSVLQCKISIQKLVQSHPATKLSEKTFSLAVKGGACEYTNTYIISPQGLTQIKTSPDNIPNGLEGSCSKFSPKTYKAEVHSEDKNLFANISVGSCKSINIVPD